jgi:putative ABC transport system permease protein
MMSVSQDVRFAVRGLRRSPGFAVASVLTLALGIGANTAVFSVADALLFRPLPFADSDRLADVMDTWLSRPGLVGVPVDPQKFEFWSKQTHIFEGIEGYGRTGVVTMLDGDDPLGVTNITEGLLSLLGVAPIVGRSFDAGEMTGGIDTTCLVSHGLWTTAFGARPTAIGERLTLTGRSCTIVGVLPSTFRLPGPDTQIWIPTNPDRPPTQPITRVRAGLTIAAAQAEVNRLAESVQRDQPLQEGWRIKLSSFDDRRTSPTTRSALLALLGGVGLVMLIACANVANLLLARTDRRDREFAIRAAMGASRPQLFRQVLVEASVLALIAGLAVLVAARLGLAAFASRLPAALATSGLDVALNGRVLWFAVAITATTGLLCGAVPALRATRASVAGLLAGAHLTGGLTRHHRAAHGTLVAVEIALTFLLLTGAALLANSFVRMASVEFGFDPRNLAAVRVTPPRSYRPLPAQDAFYNELVRRLRLLPGIRGVAQGMRVPPTTDAFYMTRAEGSRGEGTRVQITRVDDGYFRLLGIPVLEGRGIEPTDVAGSTPVVVIDRSTARHFWPGESPLGKRLRDSDVRPWMTVVGVVGRVKDVTFATGSDAFQAWMPMSQQPQPVRTLAIRSDGNPRTLFPSIRSAIRSVEPAATITITTSEAEYGEVMRQPRFFLVLMGAFAAVALSLAAIGLYGVLWYVVSRRTQEIGLRIALGADTAAVTRMVVGQALLPTGIGLACGLLGAYWLTSFLRAQLFGVSPRDPVTMIAVAAVLVATAALAACIPARRAAMLDPVAALRCDN